jgi:branched-subunit amino acid aminotransferase/4-amino-4-deoxychorismate lyase
MHKVALFNRKIVNVDEANLSGLSSAALYGKGVFTTIAIYDGKPFLLEKHLRRLRSNSNSIGLNYPESNLGEIERQLDQLINENSIVNGRARVAIFDASLSRMWSDDDTERVNILIITADQRKVPAKLNVTVSPYSMNSTSPLAGVKSCNYLENILAVNEAKSREFNEAVRLNQRGEVASACMANVFWLNGDQLYTPSLATGCLAGTTREYILENFDCREVKVDTNEVSNADGIFLTSAGIGVVQAAKLDEREFAESDHPVLDLLPSADKKTRMSAK